MKTRVWVFVIASVFTTATAWAQAGSIAEELAELAMKYDPAMVITITGEVVERTKWMWSGGELEAARVRTDGETVLVILGPRDYLASQNTKIEQGDRVTITGSKAGTAIQESYQSGSQKSATSAPMILAREVHKGNAVLVLRANDGTPRWNEMPTPTVGPQGRP